MLSALIFDLDGTLVDSAPDIHAGVARLLAEEGLPDLPFATVRGFIGGGVPTLITRVMRALDLPDDPARHADLCARFTARYEDDPQGLTRPYDGVESALDALDLPLALCTNKPEGPTRALLRHLGWTHRFPVIVGGDTLPLRKPDPAPLHHAIAATGGGPVLFVGDSEVDAETARRAGVPLLLFTEGYRSTPLADLPHAASFDHWDRMPERVARLRG
ncbi:phosphoglycolate phosphatase [Tabrizicola sp. M-4]|uniref:phosphoglycolate phosphatase n=1 Tax=Tabrizicola sp. M-4 TaxID=3055847 RepID=UPI003DA97FA1